MAEDGNPRQWCFGLSPTFDFAYLATQNELPVDFFPFDFGRKVARVLAQLRPQIVLWSTLYRADWVRNDAVLTMRG